MGIIAISHGLILVICDSINDSAWYVTRSVGCLKVSSAKKY